MLNNDIILWNLKPVLASLNTLVEIQQRISTDLESPVIPYTPEIEATLKEISEAVKILQEWPVRSPEELKERRETYRAGYGKMINLSDKELSDIE